MCGFFCRLACYHREKKIVDDIENLTIKKRFIITDDIKIYKYVMLDDIQGLREMLDLIKEQGYDVITISVATSNFAKVLLETIRSSDGNMMDSLKHINFFIDHFGLDCKHPNSSIKEDLLQEIKSKEKDYVPNLNDKEYLFYLVKRGLLCQFPTIFDDYCIQFVGLQSSSETSSEKIIQDICFLVGNSFTSFHNLRQKLPDFFSDIINSTTLFVRLDQTNKNREKDGEKIQTEKLFTDDELLEVKNQLQGRKILLEKYFLSELVPIILSFTF
jgi:hypothetical protein